MNQKLTNEQAEAIMQQSDPMGGLLDRVEQSLRDENQTELADRFARLISDIGLEQEPTFEPDPNLRPSPPGPITGALWAAYTPVTTERVKAVFADIGNGSRLQKNLRNEFSELVSTVFPPPSAPRPARAPQP